jgi:hypothetical protein
MPAGLIKPFFLDFVTSVQLPSISTEENEND